MHHADGTAHRTRGGTRPVLGGTAPKPRARARARFTAGAMDADADAPRDSGERRGLVPPAGRTPSNRPSRRGLDRTPRQARPRPQTRLRRAM